MGVGIDDVEQACLECGKVCVNRRSLGNHVARSHKELNGLQGYVLKHVIFGVVPKCACGCLQDVAWHKTFYSYNDYVNGHNPAGFKVKQPTLTPEQIEKRNRSIKRAYRDRGQEIRSKISESVTETAQRKKAEGYDYGKYFREKWRDEAYRTAQRTARVKSWQGEAGDIRRAKVFTPEFGRKISLANMQRDSKRTSVVEQMMLDGLALGFPDLVRGKWLNMSERTWCADAWIPSLSAVVEIDGLYWHGLDRISDFTIDQIKNLVNDLDKNDIARKKNMTLFRFKEGTDLTNVRTIEDLISASYHAVIDGTVVKEGSFACHEDIPVVSRDCLLLADKTWVRTHLLPALFDLLRAHVKYHGWFYPSASVEDLNDVIADLTDPNSKGSRASSWLKGFVRSFWDVDGGPRKQFMNDDALLAVLRYRLGLNNSKLYSYQLRDGSRIVANETFDINLKNVRRGFIVQRRTVSWFQPSVAAAIYRRFLVGVARPTVWDPSVGFSARLLGFSGACSSGTYIGTDPASAMIDDATRLSRELRSVRPDISVQLFKVGSERFTPAENSLDLVFTSPPYFDKERYFDEQGQCWRDFPNIDEWTIGYLKPTFQHAFGGLKPGAKMIINIGGEYVDLIRSVATDVGFSLEGQEVMNIRIDHFGKKLGKCSSAEPLLVFVKHQS